jgi:hypothetical protein
LRRKAVLTLIASLWICAVLRAEPSPWSLRTGLGYEFISQRYFADSLSQSGADTLTILTALRTNYLDDFKAQISAAFDPWKGERGRRGEFRGTWEQTPEYLRGRLGADMRLGIGQTRFDSRTEIDWRHRYRGASEAGDSYITANTQCKLSVPVGDRWSAWTQAKGEIVHFDSISSAVFSHYRVGGKAGVVRSIGEFAQAGLNFFVLGRRVPDSTALDYLSFGLETDLIGLSGQADYDLTAMVERKNYQQPNGQDDYWRMESNSYAKWELGARWYVRSELMTELLVFSDSDQFNTDYFRLRVAALPGIESGYFSIEAGPQIEFLASKTTDSLAEDYREAGLRVDIDYLKSGGGICSVESVTGYRRLKSESSAQSNFSFERLNLLADLAVAPRLSLNVLVSTEWEWHSNETHNATTLLLSTGLTYQF